MAFFLVAISLGFLGSFHCVGMCGPIALALPVHHRTPYIKHLLILLYNSGRILTYSLLGLFAGLLGKSLSVFGFQQALSIFVGLSILVVLWLPLNHSLPGYRFFIGVKTRLSRLFTKGNA